MPKPQPKSSLVIRYLITYIGPSLVKSCPFILLPYFAAVFSLLWSVWPCPYHDIAIGKDQTYTHLRYLTGGPWSFFPCFSLNSSSTSQTILGLILYASWIYLTSPRIIINESYKIVVTSNRYRLGRPQTSVWTWFIIPLVQWVAMLNFTLVFFLMTQCSQKFNLQVLAHFNRPYFVRACKDFSLVCPSLICHSLVESLFESIEVATCPITVLPFK